MTTPNCSARRQDSQRHRHVNVSRADREAVMGALGGGGTQASEPSSRRVSKAVWSAPADGSRLSARPWVVATGLAVGGCGSSNSSTQGCFSKSAAAGSVSAAGGSASPSAGGNAGTAAASLTPVAAAGWALPGGDLANTRDVASAITSSNVSRLGVAHGACRSSRQVSAVPLGCPMVTRRRRSW
jgi:hypothetical protein